MREHPELLILRHGQTEWNLARRYQGSCDSPLTALGREQALAQRRLLATLPDLPAQAFVSPLGRAVETARIALADLAPAVMDDRLQEIAFGAWEGLTRDEIAALPGSPDDDGDWFFQSPGGETFDDIMLRVADFLDSLDAPAIVVTHGITSRVLRGLCMGLDAAGLLELPIPQGCVFHVSQGRETILGDPA